MSLTVIKKVYLDNAATTPLHPEVFEKMKPFLTGSFGNPSSIHSFGREVRIALEDARETIANIINADPGEIYFTSNGTEANNLALFGIALTEREDSGKNHILTTTAEHQCVLEPFENLDKLGFTMSLLPVNNFTQLELSTLKGNITDATSLVSAIHINNETGSVNDIKSLAQLARESGTWFHTDAVQSFGKVKIDVKDLGIHSLSVSGHKFFGPKGSGFTWAKSGTPLQPMIYGGSQERNRRGGTENPPAIIGMAEAATIAVRDMDKNNEKVKNLKNRFCEIIKNHEANGITLNSDESFSPYIISMTMSPEFFNNDAESILMYLDINGVAASNGAACTSGTLKPSHVIMASGKSAGEASGTIRFSLSPLNNIDEIDYAANVVKKLINNFRL